MSLLMPAGRCFSTLSFCLHSCLYALSVPAWQAHADCTSHSIVAMLHTAVPRCAGNQQPFSRLLVPCSLYSHRQHNMVILTLSNTKKHTARAVVTLVDTTPCQHQISSCQPPCQQPCPLWLSVNLLRTRLQLLLTACICASIQALHTADLVHF